jgi:hypothetical protein
MEIVGFYGLLVLSLVATIGNTQGISTALDFGDDLSCSCGGFRPCQHAFGDACYEMVHNTGGSRGCPAETTHCDCPCTDQKAPCHNVGSIILNGQAEAQQCLDTVVMFGQTVCPATSVHCRAHYQPKVAPTPAPATMDCPCTLRTPCRSDTEPYTCTATLDSAGACPTNHAQCLPTGLTPSCVCGGGRPCQFRHSAECFEKGLDESGILQCPEHTVECNCPCPMNAGDGPCHTTSGDTDFCSAVNSKGVCEQGVHCQRSGALGGDHVYQHLSKFPSSVPSVGNAIPVQGQDIQCVVTQWSMWQPCSKACDGGEQERFGVHFHDTGTNGAEFNCHRVEKQECNTHACDVRDCVEMIPSDWGQCTMSCGGGWEEKKPRILEQPKDGGNECSPTQRRQCNTESCTPALTCMCNPLTASLEPDLPRPTKHKLQCSRVNGVVTMVHPPGEDYYKCAFSSSTGCACCSCKTKRCDATSWGPWSTCDMSTGLKTRTRLVQTKVFLHDQCPRVSQTSACGHLYPV